MCRLYCYCIVLGLFLVCGSRISIERATPQAKLTAFYERLNSDCGNSFFTINEDFNRDFPRSEQADALADVIESAANRREDSLIVGNAIYFVGTFVRPDGSKPWNQRLENALLAQAQNVEPRVRQSLAAFLSQQNEPQKRKRILFFLNDESDDVRECVIGEINGSKWPDALAIDQAYIARTPIEGLHHKSVISAMRYLNPADNERAGNIRKISSHADAQEYYLEYVVQHQNDPTYAISVDAAQSCYKSIQDKLDYAKAAAMEKERADMLHRAVLEEKHGIHAPQRSFDEQVTLMFWVFDTKDSSTNQYAGQYFKLVTPLKEQSRLLTAIAKRAMREPLNNNVLMNVFGIAAHLALQVRQSGSWNRELESIVWAQRSNSDPHIRSGVIDCISKWALEDWRNRVLWFLNDSDPAVRDSCVAAISYWPDRHAVYSRYLANYESDPFYKNGVHLVHTLRGGIWYIASEGSK